MTTVKDHKYPNDIYPLGWFRPVDLMIHMNLFNREV